MFIKRPGNFYNAITVTEYLYTLRFEDGNPGNSNSSRCGRTETISVFSSSHDRNGPEPLLSTGAIDSTISKYTLPAVIQVRIRILIQESPQKSDVVKVKSQLIE